MNYYPVFIPTLNRYEHFKRCVESLAKNTHAIQTELVVGLDYPPNDKYMEGYLKIRDYIPTISGFRKVTVFERTENLGAERNGKELLKYGFDNYDAVISTEDDNEFSPCFLDYMNKALDYYWHDMKVFSVSGFLNKRFYGEIDTPLLFSYDNNAWGMGLWKHKFVEIDLESFDKIIRSFSKSWKVFKTSPGIFGMLISMVKGKHVWGDVFWSVSNILNNTCQLRPSYSLVRNTGYDGSGLHCGTNSLEYSNQKISENLVFDIDFSNVTPVTNRVIKKKLFHHEMPQNHIKVIEQYIRLLYHYARLYINMVCDK